MTTLTSSIASAKTSDLVFVSQSNELVTDSLHVAKYFGKRHIDVINKIKSLHCSSEFGCTNFFTHPYRNTQNGETYQAYQMTKDGFMFLVMGFTGKRAAEIKERYIRAFNEMANKLTQQTPNEIMPIMPPSSMRVLMYMEKGHVVSMQPVPEDSVVFRTEDIPKLLRESGYFSVRQLKDVADTALAQLAMCAEQAVLIRR